MSTTTTIDARINGVTAEGVFLALWGKVLLFPCAYDVQTAAAGLLFKRVRATIEDRGAATAELVGVVGAEL